MNIQSRGGKIATGTTVIAANLKKVSVVIDREGNQIDLKTKKVIKPKSE